MWDKWIFKKLFLVRVQILGLFLNTMTTIDKISASNRDNFAQEIKIQLPQQPKIFSERFIAFLKSTSSFEYFGKKRVS